MRIFFTGITGFAGSHLADLLLAAGHDVFGLVHAASSTQATPQHPCFRPIPGDLLDLDGLKYAVAETRPDVIYHLAGQPYPARSWENAARTLVINTGGTANVLEAAVNFGRPRVLVVTSAEIYGKVRPNQLPLSERSLPKPRHPYGVSKEAAGKLVQVFAERYDLPVIEARPFNHIGPRQAPGFVVPDFAGQLAAIQLGHQPPTMRVGNLSAERDFTDVRDVVQAYRLLAERGQPGQAYLICSGQPVAIHTILNILLELSGLTVNVEYDPARMRPSDVPVLYGTPAKISAELGWRPQIHLRTTLKDVLTEWREHYGERKNVPASSPG
ncbi:MAG: GDP-mannose 4,6-dehydratase [Anaerolineae bacterium]|nr:GDP-mannose 4,6-dehydratase [Anaerolineae bacterium]MCO5205383.1 GDP-mannose 4,6-dehydratase [Anaerolineae bacterium]